MNKFLGVSLMVLAVALMVLPAFSDCQSQGKSLVTSTGKEIPMKCHWTGLAEIGVGVPLLAVGAMMTVNRRRSNAMNLGFMGIVLGGLAIAFPAFIIGVCATPTMICHTLMKPALMTLGSVAVIGSLAAVITSRKLGE
jgi:hypothetical protein